MELLTKGSPAEITPEKTNTVEFKNQEKLAAADPAAEKPKLPTESVEATRGYYYKDGEAAKSYFEDYEFWHKAGAGMVSFWVTLVFMLALGFGYSYFWTASSMIYLLMRKKVDETEIDEVYVEEELDEPPPETPVQAPAPAPAAPVSMPVDAPTLRAAPAPAPTPPPAAPAPVEPPPAPPAQQAITEHPSEPPPTPPTPTV